MIISVHDSYQRLAGIIPNYEAGCEMLASGLVHRLTGLWAECHRRKCSIRGLLRSANADGESSRPQHKANPLSIPIEHRRSQLSSRSFILKPLDESVDPHSLQLFSWTPKQNRLHVAFSNGKWGYYGELKPSGVDEFTGNLQYFCDWRGHCGKHAVATTVHRMDCL